jgi:uncharacterized protein
MIGNVFPKEKRAVLLSELRHQALISSSLHGPRHWIHVWRLGRELSVRARLDEKQSRCVDAFALFHDLGRQDDGLDPEHGTRSAAIFMKCATRLITDLTEFEAEIISLAIRWHSKVTSIHDNDGKRWPTTDDWSIKRVREVMAVCWDADRLDLLRLGIPADPAKMSTAVWRSIVPLAKRLNARSLPTDSGWLDHDFLDDG